uniref:Uncharacterized protein n=1 Tax=Cannabis sativa TaxID=3483 RepID=A0A803QSD3_CANSA
MHENGVAKPQIVVGKLCVASEDLLRVKAREALASFPLEKQDDSGEYFPGQMLVSGVNLGPRVPTLMGPK